MEKRLQQVLENNAENYILPFLWLHGEEESYIRKEIEKIHASGIGAVCVESRPHPDFLGNKWWRDMDIIMEEAKQRGMKVWVLDDAHFPTGYANGQVEASLAGKIYLDHYCIDAIGPLEQSSFIIRLEEGEQLVGVTAGRRRKAEESFLSELKDITHLVKDNMLYFDVPEGFWCITVIKTTHNGSGRQNYINTIDKEAVSFFINTVYEAHYTHYKKEFGGTFAGFFSDEPEIGNAIGEYGLEARVGIRDMALPWCEELKERLKNQWGSEYLTFLSGLWHVIEEVSPKAKYDFMNHVSDLYGKNFCTQIGDWCRFHKVEYIGHVIEDEGCHTRLGLGAGHFFRALWGQDMSGIDVVLQQIRPELNDTPFYRIDGKHFYHGEFFHYGLAKLGVSLGQIDSKKQGRTMCEIYGAYGWAEGLKLMKWLTDHMLTCGVNYFVPHAFSPQKFPDPDCPPHFYAGGNNPQYPYFKYLMDYMNRICHLTNGGRHISKVAVLYHAEAEWAGEYEPFEKVGRELTRNQIDFKVIPMDILLESRVKDKQIEIGLESCPVLVIPKSRYLPERLLDWCEKAIQEGACIVFMDQLPMPVSEERNTDISVEFKTDNKQVMAMENLVLFLRNMQAHEIELSCFSPALRYYHYKQENGDFYLFFNESLNEEIKAKVKFPVKPVEAWRYHAFENMVEEADLDEDGRLKLTLEPNDTYIVYIGKMDEKYVVEKSSHNARFSLENQLWRISLIEAGKEEKMLSSKTLDQLINITNWDQEPDFSGTIIYETSFELEKALSFAEIDFGKVFETADVWINEEHVGVRIAPPYRLKLKKMLKAGKNDLKVIVTNTLVHQQRDYFSTFLPIEPSGLLGPVWIYGKEE